MDTHIIPASDPQALQRAAAMLKRGGLVAFPTDTVYGLGALVHNRGGIERLYLVKGRESAKAIPILLSDLGELTDLVSEVEPRARRLAERFWPGPLTLVLPRHLSLLDVLTPYPTVGLRMPDHPTALALLKRTGPLAVTSANLSGQPSAVTAQEVFEYLGGRIDLILDGGRTPGGMSSTVVDCTGSDLAILRQGPLSLDDLLSAL